MKPCKQCKNEFEITDADCAFYNKINVPEPTLCPDCRQRRRMAWRNERTIYSRKCDLSGKDIISVYPVDAPFPVYSPEAWNSDSWDQYKAGQDFDFSRPFFEQFFEVALKVPHMALHVVYTQNAPFINQSWHIKNSYLCFDVGYSEDCFYCHVTYNAKDCVETSFTHKAELCYNTIDVVNCYNSIFIQQCNDCNSAAFCYDCRNCSDIILCSNLRNKKYCILNKQYSKEEYEKEKVKYSYRTRESLEKMRMHFDMVKRQAIHKFSNNINCENCYGDYLLNSRNMYKCFDADKCENCRYVCRMDADIKDSMDLDNGSEGELLYESTSIAGNNNKFCHMIPSGYDIEYSSMIYNSTQCFGCVQMHNQEYCILNKKYTKEEYIKLKAKIIDHMRQTGEYGEFFPAWLSPFGYNETVAQDYFPDTKEHVKALGFNWRDEIPFTQGKETMLLKDVPSSVDDVDIEKMSGQILACKNCKRNYKLIKQELVFYKKIGVPIPEECTECRFKGRINSRNPHHLWHRKCANCTNEFETTYAPDRSEKVFCETCYQKEIL